MSTPITPAAVVAAAASRPRALPRRALGPPAHVGFARQQQERAAGLSGLDLVSGMTPGRFAVEMIGQGAAVPMLSAITAAPEAPLLDVKPPIAAPTCGTGIGGVWCRVISWIRSL